MSRTYSITRSEAAQNEWTVVQDLGDGRQRLALLGVRLPTKRQAEIIAMALREAYAAGAAEVGENVVELRSGGKVSH
jgi:hypothetical protein